MSELRFAHMLIFGHRPWLASILLGFAAIVCASCQTSEVTGDVSDTAAVAAVEAQPAQKFGNGEARVTLMLNLSGSLANEALNRALLNGARLAVEDLGSDDLTLIVEDSNSSPERITQTVSRSTDAELIIVPGEGSGIAPAIARMPRGPAPVIALGRYEEAMTPGSYWFLPTWIDELAQATDFASRSFGKKLNVVILLPAAIDRKLAGLLTRKIEKVSEKTTTVPYVRDEGLTSIDPAGRKALDAADAVIIMEDDAAVAAFVDQLRKTEFANSQKFFIVRGDVAERFSSNLAFAGALAAVPDLSNFEIVANRYQQVYSARMPVEAAYTYDAVAIAAGLIRANERHDINRPMLEAKSGFNGASGSFRFHADGQVERIYNIVRLSNGDLDILETAPAGF